MEEIKPTLPSGTQLTVTQDGGEEASLYLNNVIEALIFGAGLTIFVVYAFLNSWRSTLITALSLPTSAIAAFIAVWLAGFTLNFMTLLGLSLAVGVLIDDAIVVRENIVRHLERGEDRVTAARNGTAEIGLAVTATTFSIMAVFVPVAFMGGVRRRMVPAVRAHRGDLGAGQPVHLLHARPDAVGLLGRSAGLRATPSAAGWARSCSASIEWFDHQADRYGRVIAWALHHRIWMAVIAVASLAAALALQVTVGGTRFPAEDRRRDDRRAGAHALERQPRLQPR